MVKKLMLVLLMVEVLVQIKFGAGLIVVEAVGVGCW